MFGLHQTGARDHGEGALDDLLVFLRLDGAGAVDNDAAGFHHLQGAAEEGKLMIGHAEEVFLREAPADVDAAAEDAGI